MDKQATPVRVLGLDFNCVYVDDFQAALDFYARYFQFEKKFDMGPSSCWGTIGETGLFISGGHKRQAITPDTVHTSVMYRISDAHALFARLKQDGVPVLHDSPQDMGQGWWFEFVDPAGNILEVLSYKEEVTA